MKQGTKMKRGHEARRKNEERTQELEEEKVRRRKAEKVLKEFQSQMTGKSVDKLEAQKRERVKKAEKRKEAFKKKKEVQELSHGWSGFSSLG